MTPAQHAAYIRQLEFKLHKARYGMGMPYQLADIAHYERLIAEAKRSLAGLPVDIIRHFTEVQS